MLVFFLSLFSYGGVAAMLWRVIPSSAQRLLLALCSLLVGSRGPFCSAGHQTRVEPLQDKFCPLFDISDPFRSTMGVGVVLK